MKRIFLTGALFALSTNLAFAEDKGGFFLEPSLTYEHGKSKVNFPDTLPLDDSDGDINGFGAGLRLGFHVYDSLFVGFDGRYSVPNFEDSSLDQDVKATAYNYGPVVGLQMPTTLGLRFWGTWVIGAEIDPEKDQGVDEKFTDGHGYRIGAGIKLGYVSLNLEHQLLKYRDVEIEDAGIFGSGNFDDTTLEQKAWILSVSFPISL